MSAASLSTRASAIGLGAIAATHLAWAAGSSWPLDSREALADAVVGTDRVPSATACVAIAGLLGTAAALVSGHPRGSPRLSRLGARAVVATLAVRGVLGLVGRTDVLSPGSDSRRFRALDRRLYSPLCLVLAALALPAAAGRASPY